jgi:hypothetical protein
MHGVSNGSDRYMKSGSARGFQLQFTTDMSKVRELPNSIDDGKKEELYNQKG